MTNKLEQLKKEMEEAHAAWKAAVTAAHNAVTATYAAHKAAEEAYNKELNKNQ